MNNPKLDNLMPVKDGLIILEKKFAFLNVKITGARSQLKLKLQYLATRYEELTDYLEKTLMLGKMDGRRRRG